MPKLRPESEADRQAASELTEAVGRRLTALFDVVGWTQVQVGELLAADQSTVSKWLSGKRMPAPHYVVRIAEQSGASLDFIYGGKLGGVMRPDLELRLAARLPELVLGTRPEAAERLEPARRAKAKDRVP